MKAPSRTAAMKAKPKSEPVKQMPNVVHSRYRNPVVAQAFAGLEKERKAEAKEEKKRGAM